MTQKHELICGKTEPCCCTGKPSPEIERLQADVAKAKREAVEYLDSELVDILNWPGSDYHSQIEELRLRLSRYLSAGEEEE